MEHLTDADTISHRTGIADRDRISKLISYAEAIHTDNTMYNLTGHKTLPEIMENLVIKSLEPLKNMNVPRGTLFGDLGTGAGIPGVPLAIKYDRCEGILFDSNQKKVRFINNTCRELGINNVKAVDSRIEDACRNTDYRGMFDLIFTRAMSDIYTITELGAPLLKTGGMLYMYVHIDRIELNEYISAHIAELGLSETSPGLKQYSNENRITEGLLLEKTGNTDDRYPRRIAVIKRMASK